MRNLLFSCLNLSESDERAGPMERNDAISYLMEWDLSKKLGAVQMTVVCVFSRQPGWFKSCENFFYSLSLSSQRLYEG